MKKDMTDIEKADDKGMLDRRTMLTAAAATAAGLIGSAAFPAIASAATGDAVHAGQEAVSTGSDPGLWGNSPGGDGVVGWGGGVNKSGVWGSNQANGGAGVTGDGKMAGVVARGGATGDGVQGSSSAANKSGVWGNNAANVGVYGTGKQGVVGVGGGTGFGVWAINAADTGWALGVTGKAWFTRSGVASIAKNKTSVVVTVPLGVDATSSIVATPQSSLGTGVFVTYCGNPTTTTTFTIHLNKKATKAGKVAWFMFENPPVA